MKKSFEPQPSKALELQEQQALYGLELPDAPNFNSRPARRTLAEMLPWLARIRTYFPQSIPSQEERLASKTDAEFTL